jgi:hypothetical protein
LAKFKYLRTTINKSEFDSWGNQEEIEFG